MEVLSGAGLDAVKVVVDNLHILFLFIIRIAYVPFT